MRFLVRARFSIAALGLSALMSFGCSSSPSSNGAGGAGGVASDGGPEGAAGSTEAGSDADAGLVNCVAPPPPAAALLKMNEKNGPFLLPDGRALTPAGRTVKVGGFPLEVRVNPNLPVAYVDNGGYNKRAIEVVNLTTGAILQDLTEPDSFYGMQLSPDGKHLYTSGGTTGMLEVYDVAQDGTLTASGQADINGYPSGIAVSPDAQTIYVGRYLATDGTEAPAVVEVDATTLAVQKTITLPMRAYALALVPQKNELYVSGFGATSIAVVDLSTGQVTATISAGSNPLGLVPSADGSHVYGTVSGDDVVISIDTTQHAIVGSEAVGEPSIAGSNGKPLPASSPTGIALDSATNKLYVTRAADNAVEVLDASTLKVLGSIPVGWYPTGVALAQSGTELVVTNGKGVGTGPLTQYSFADASGKDAMTGTVSIVDLSRVDLASASKQVLDNVLRPSTVYPFKCNGVFPVPTHPGGPTPIRHIVLIVRENKTYDTELGDLGSGDSDPSLVLFGKNITPNLHALAKMFTNHDNFYNDSETSIQGHLWLTSSFVNDYIERMWIEDYRGDPGFSDSDADLPRGQPTFGTFFLQLLKSKISFTDFGEITGIGGAYHGQSVASHIDPNFPGHFFDLAIKDQTKAAYVGTQLVDNNKFPTFAYVLLPDDHTYGTSPGKPTPESMINDNDYATGMLVDKISHSAYWKSTAIFIVEDDPQIGADHVDYHRSYCIVVSPYAKHGYTSSVHLSFPSLFRTFELILNVPPLNREDALATPFYDAFTMNADMTPYTALPRTVPDSVNSANAPGAAWSKQMDFRGPDRNPDLGAVLYWERKGYPPPRSRIARQIRLGLPPTVAHADPDDDDADFDGMKKRYYEYLREHPAHR